MTYDSTARLVTVTGYWVDEGPDRELTAVFGVMPKWYDADPSELDDDEVVQFWLEYDEELVVGQEYGDFIVTGVEEA